MAASFARTPGHDEFGYHIAGGNAVMDLTRARENERTGGAHQPGSGLARLV